METHCVYRILGDCFPSQLPARMVLRHTLLLDGLHKVPAVQPARERGRAAVLLHPDRVLCPGHPLPRVPRGAPQRLAGVDDPPRRDGRPARLLLLRQLLPHWCAHHAAARHLRHLPRARQAVPLLPAPDRRNCLVCDFLRVLGSIAHALLPARHHPLHTFRADGLGGAVHRRRPNAALPHLQRPAAAAACATHVLVIPHPACAHQHRQEPGPRRRCA
mmetsp:Transcript_40526/g.120915  ORF Transcript_40526/g.120915 Transcript_40526/m.120915 type:complete len:217 (+) Transcript_40526:478-1128(+)